MYFKRKWNEIMGPKDERLVGEENKAAKAGYGILLVGSVICLYYAIMLNQVANTTNHPILTPLGESLVPVQLLLAVMILCACAVNLTIQIKSGSFSSYMRFAQVDSIPWDFVALGALFCGVVLGVLTCGMRVVAEIQIVGIANVAWFGDLAIGVIFFIMGFILGFAAFALTIRDAIKRRRELDRELEA